MPNLVNEAITSEYTALLDDTLDALFVQPVGMSVEDVNAFRGMLAESQLRMKVVKGSLARRAMEASGFSGLDDLFVGPAALVVADAEGVDAVAITAAKVVERWRKESGGDLPAVKGGVMDGEVLDDGAAAALAKLPGKAELQAILVGQIVGPARTLAGQFQSGGGKIAGAIKSHIEKLEQAG